MPLNFDNSAYMPFKPVKYNDEDINIEIDSVRDPQQQKIWAQFSPDSNPGANPWDGSSSSVFTVQSDRVQFISDFVLQLNIQNTSGSDSVTFLAGAYPLNRIEERINGSVWSTIYPYMLYFEYLSNYPQEFIVALQNELNISPTTYGANVTIAASGTGKLWIPFRSLICDTVYLSQTISQIQYQFYYASSPYTGTGTPVINQAYLLAYGLSFSPAQRDILVKRLNSKKHMTRTILRRDGSISISGATDSVPTQQPITALTGQFACLNFAMRGAANTRANLYLFEQLDAITILDSSGVPVGGWQDAPGVMYQTVMPKLVGGYPGQGFQAKRIYHFPLADAPCETENTGVSTGSAIMNGKWQIRFTPISQTTSPQNVNVQMVGYEYVMIIQNVDGSLDINYL